MWLLTSIGFFSIVQKPGDVAGGTLTVRARAADDLDVLRARYLPTLSKTLAKAGTDYPFRATAPCADVADALARLATLSVAEATGGESIWSTAAAVLKAASSI